MQSVRMRSRHSRGGIIGGLLKLIGLGVVGLIGLGVLGSTLGRRPTPAPEPMPAAVAPGPVAQPVPRTVAQPVPKAVAQPAPAQDVRFGLSEEKRAEINNCRWQGGMWATAEVERLIPMDQAPQNDPEAWERFMKERDSFYKGRETIAERLAAKKYGLPVETIRAIDDEWGEKPMERRMSPPWKVSETPMLFDRDEANRAVATHSMVPLTPEEKTREDRQRLIDSRKGKRGARSKQPR